MNYGLPALLIGWFLTFFLFCLGLAVASMVAEGLSGGGLGLYFLPISLIYGFPAAAVVGLPLALLVAWPLRRVRRQWIHVVAFACAVGAAGAGMAALLASGAPGGGVDWQGPVIMGAWAGCCAAAGRASVIRMVAARNRPAVNSH
ncbi:hypothetical protein [Arthrobacter sp. HY1533]|uniref:hypothetical protein n=1 Tax=Arthrobacter sp. HY1533 TaxID=2970919 RepID=UPI0022B9E83D|nr:hypothetical protein [Arthrobacter sp. HY1533]